MIVRLKSEDNHQFAKTASDYKISPCSEQQFLHAHIDHQQHISCTWSDSVQFPLGIKWGTATGQVLWKRYQDPYHGNLLALYAKKITKEIGEYPKLHVVSFLSSNQHCWGSYAKALNTIIRFAEGNLRFRIWGPISKWQTSGEDFAVVSMSIQISKVVFLLQSRHPDYPRN